MQEPLMAPSTINITQVYTLTSTVSGEEIYEFCSALEGTLASLPRNDIMVRLKRMIRMTVIML